MNPRPTTSIGRRSRFLMLGFIDFAPFLPEFSLSGLLIASDFENDRERTSHTSKPPPTTKPRGGFGNWILGLLTPPLADFPVVGEAKQEFFVVGKAGKLIWYSVLGEEHPQAQSLRRPERSEGRRKDWAWGCGGRTLLS
jgi:hypothetical protein